MAAGRLASSAERFAGSVLDRLRAGEAARREVLHQTEEKRQVRRRYPLLVERQDEIAAARMQQKIRILDPFRDALIGQKIADIVAGEKLLQFLAITSV